MNQTASALDNRALLRTFVEEQTDSLLGTLRAYVVRAGLAGEQGANLAAVELLNEVVVEALAHADRFRPSGSPMAWLLGIAANLIRRQQAQRATRARREPLVGDLLPAGQQAISEEDLFDRLASLAAPAAGSELEAEQEVAALLARVSDDDRQVLRQAVLRGLSGRELALALGTTPGAARVRLHRALNRLRAALAAATLAEE